MRAGLLATTACAFALAAGGVLAAPASAMNDGPAQPPKARASFFVWTQDFQDGKNSNHLVVADAHGRHERVLTHPGPGVQDIDPRIAPDGHAVLFERDTENQASVAGIVGLGGHAEQILPLDCTDPCAGVATPVWTPDGRQVVFSRVIGPFDAVNHSARSAVLWRSDLDGSHLTRISPRGIDGAYEDYDASFAPAGYIIFLRVRNADTHNAVFRMDVDGSHVRQLTPWSLDADLPAVSQARVGPTRDLVVFETYGQGPPEGFSQAVATVPARCRSLAACTARIQTLTPTTPRSANDFTECFNPSWSPDGRSIAYVAFEYRKGADKAMGQIRTMRFDGTHKRVLSHDSYFDYRPAWGLLPAKKTVK